MQETHSAPQASNASIECPLIGPQLGIWLAEQITSQKNAFTVAQYIEINGEIDCELLTTAIRLGLCEADTLHSCYQDTEYGPTQLIFPAPTPDTVTKPVVIDLSGQKNAASAAHQIMADDLNQALPADSGRCLYHHILINVSASADQQQWFWYQRYHHLQLDGFSFTALTKRIALIYSSLYKRVPVVKSSFTPFTDVVTEYQNYQQSKKFEKDFQFWSDYTKQLVQPLTLSHVTHLPLEQLSNQSLRHRITIDKNCLEKLQEHHSNAKLTPTDIFTAVIFVYLSRFTDSQQVVVGFPFMRRMGSAALSATGPVANILPLQLEISPEHTLADAAHSLSWELRKLRKHQRYESEQLQRDTGIVGNQRKLYGPTINCKLFDYKLDFAGIAGSTHQLATGPIDDLEFAIYLENDKLLIEMAANPSRYTKTELTLHGERLCHFFNQLQHSPHITADQLSILSAQEKHQIDSWSTGKQIDTVQYGNTILDVFKHTVSKQPLNTAIVFENESISFSSLSAKANQLSRALLSRGARKNTIVAVALPRSINSIISILAIQNTGAAYLPLDLNHPDERLSMMCDDACPIQVITHTEIQHRLTANLNCYCLDEAETLVEQHAQSADPIRDTERGGVIDKDQLAYIFYTSGSTGKPKGVMVSHGPLLNLLAALQDPIFSQAQDACKNRTLNVALTGSFSFDTSWDPLLLMILGHQLYLYSDSVKRDVYTLIEAINTHKIDTLAVAPSLATALMNAGLMDKGQHHPTLMNICGEPVSPALWKQLQQTPQLQAYNIYGPTEFTVYATSVRVRSDQPTPVIGQPLANTRVYVLDKHLQPVPIGVPGELYLAGDNMTSGYLHRPSTTASRFVANPFSHGQIMYLTGDIVRWNSNGEIEFIGRSDSQVKVRGFRIELGEVESALTSLAQVDEAVVIIEPSLSGNRLIAYCTLSETLNHDEQISTHILNELCATLPDYMLPSSLTVLEYFPLTVSGKIDKKSLPKPEQKSHQISHPPKTERELLLCQAMATTLRIESIDMNDDFFGLGGDSISAMQLGTELRKVGLLLKPGEIFSQRTVRKMLTDLRPLETDNSLKLSTVNPEQLQPHITLSKEQLSQITQKHGPILSVLPVLPLQEGLLFHQQLGNQVNSYTFTTRLNLTGPVDNTRLKAALDRVLEKHPQLAARFDMDVLEKPLQLLPMSKQSWPWSEHDIADLTPEEQQQRVHQIEMQEASRVFDDNIQHPLLHATLLRLQTQQYVLLISAHHLVIDGWSTPILIKDLLQAYNDIGNALHSPQIKYEQVINQLAARQTKPAREAWQQVVENIQPTLIYTGHEQPLKVHEYTLALETQLADELTALCRDKGLTLNTLMRGVWATLLASLSGTNDVVFGTPVSGRFSSVDGIDEHIGLFSNTLPVRIKLNPEKPLLQQLPEVQAQQARLLEFDSIGLGEIQHLAGTDTLFDTLLVVENYPADEALFNNDYHNVQLTGVNNRGFTHYPLTLLILPGKQPRILIEYRDNVIGAQSLVSRFVSTLESLIKEPELPVYQLSLQTSTEQAFFTDINNTEVTRKKVTLQQLLVKQAQLTPQHIALVDSEQSLTYSEVRTQVEKLARYLSLMGVSVNDKIAVAIPRSNNLSIALQAIIEVGAAYLPLDTSYPDERLAFMIDDARPGFIITHSSEFERISNISLSQESPPLLKINEILSSEEQYDNIQIDNSDLTINDPAYIIYTSGSTGRPKGVLVSHDAIVNRLQWMQNQYSLDSSDVVLQKTPASFDVSVWEFFWPLIQGASLFSAPSEAHRDPEQLLQLILKHRVSTIHFVPSMLAAFVSYIHSVHPSADLNLPLQRVFCSGEALSNELVSQYQQLFDTPLHNLYGPTEAAIDVTFCQAAPLKNYPGCGTGIPIGKPVWNTQLRILDPWLREVGTGVAGELYLCGEQLAIGYLNRASLTAERFVADPYSNGKRMYRTGDIVRWLPSGDVEYLGRCDDQLKIRGQRIEIGEIEQALLDLPEVLQATVHARTLQTTTHASGDNRQLVAYVVLSTALLNTQKMLSTLAQSLPEYMLPYTIVKVDSFPLSANGKLDRKALPDPLNTHQYQGRPPKQGIESNIANVFKQILEIDDVNANDSFFALGGHSLLAMQLAARLRTELELPVSIGQIMVSPTVESLATVLADEDLRNDAEKSGFGQVLPIRQGQGLPLICINPGSGFAWQYTGFPKYLNGNWPIIGLQSPRPNGAVAVCENMERAVDHYLELLRRVQPHGPYHFLGYSFGGTVAVALASRLEAKGEKVAFVGLLDTYPPEGQEWRRPTEKEAMEEVEREKSQFMNAAQGEIADASSLEEQTKMFNDIVANYDDTVRLLSNAKTLPYHGETTIFVAEKTLPEGWDVRESWAPFIQQLTQYRLPFAHDDIMSAHALETLGPLLNNTLQTIKTLTDQ